MPPFKVIIVGAGLAGSLLANGLLLNGIDCTLFERDSARDDSQELQSAMYKGKKREGYQIRLGSNALAGFKACLTQQQFDDCIKLFGRSGGLVSAAPVLYNARFDTVLQDLTKFPAYTKSAPINRVVLRDFLSEPVRAAGKLRHNKYFTKYEVVKDSNSDSTKIRVHFRDGSTDEADILISAEGTGSKINAQVGLRNIIQLKETVGFLAKGRLNSDKLRKLPPEVTYGPITCIKDGKILFFSAYLPPPKTKSHGSEQVQYDEEAASLFWAFNVPTTCLPPGGMESVLDKTNFCLQQMADWSPKYHALLQAADHDDIYVFQPHASTMPAKAWRDKAATAGEPEAGHCRVWLMGDAIHPMLPGRGMGGNQAMRDTADVLAHILPLAELARDGQAVTDSLVHKAVRDYEDCMIPRAFDWVKKSGGTGMKLPDPESFQGKMMLWLSGMVLRLAYVLTVVWKPFSRGTPQDDAPELPD
ncbi:hypothetical protein BJY01DRAFT_254026 [Aspergillus pseudoustus]|uniref:FAD-binding domain-containing protein n=1 Tax=Aspergillus pseudoustus TaxID=1810923 RepID=A0ABR4IWR4_9EURO